jgi:hypothetical protein
MTKDEEIDENAWQVESRFEVLGGQNCRPDCRGCGRSTRQVPRLELSLLDLLRQFDAADRDARRIQSPEVRRILSSLTFISLECFGDGKGHNRIARRGCQDNLFVKRI